MFCTADNNYKYIEGVDLLPGEEIAIRDSMFPATVYKDRGLPFYAVAANHQLSDSAFSSYAVFDITTPVNERNILSDISIYPNPTHEIIYLENAGKSPDLIYQIFNAQGSLLIKGNITNSTINLSELNPGVYWVRIYNQSGTLLKSITRM